MRREARQALRPSSAEELRLNRWCAVLPVEHRATIAEGITYLTPLRSK